MVKISAFVVLRLITTVAGWISSSRITHPHPLLSQRYDGPSSQRRRAVPSSSESSDDESSPVPKDIQSAIQNIATELWVSRDALDRVASVTPGGPLQGEMPLPSNIRFKDRFAYFLEEAERGDAGAQHSVGLLLWNGFGSVDADPEASAKWHVAAAVQGNVDALAVFGGCLRTGTGVGKNKNIALGLQCIEYAASVGNPSGVNKKAALFESNDDWFGASRLYEQCYDDEATRKNALLLFNWGYCLVNGNGVGRNVQFGERIWKEAVDMSPDEGSEEAAYFLYEQYVRDDVVEARRWLEISAELGYQEAMELM